MKKDIRCIYISIIIDPDIFPNIAFEDFLNKYTANKKLYDNIEDMLKDREKLNSSLEKL